MAMIRRKLKSLDRLYPLMSDIVAVLRFKFTIKGRVGNNGAAMHAVDKYRRRSDQHQSARRRRAARYQRGPGTSPHRRACLHLPAPGYAPPAPRRTTHGTAAPMAARRGPATRRRRAEAARAPLSAAWESTARPASGSPRTVMETGLVIRTAGVAAPRGWR